MVRSRSRSPDRRDRRGVERGRDRRDRDRQRSRSRSPHRHPRHRSQSPRSSRDLDGGESSSSSDKKFVPEPVKKTFTEADLEGKTEEEINMMTLMGFGGFESTKGKKVNGNNVYVANISKKRRYRQYMNRKGGFNRPLDFIA